MKDYEKMWEDLKYDVALDLSMLTDPKTEINYVDILRISTAKLIQQSMNHIEENNK